jgi:hypothetical protein
MLTCNGPCGLAVPGEVNDRKLIVQSFALRRDFIYGVGREAGAVADSGWRRDVSFETRG